MMSECGGPARLTQTMRALRVELEQVCRQLPVSQPARG